MNIRAYRILCDGTPLNYFEHKDEDSRGAIITSTIQGLVLNVRDAVARAHRRGINFVSIDLSPHHEICCPSNLASHRCVPLTEQERNEFWKYFTEPRS